MLSRESSKVLEFSSIMRERINGRTAVVTGGLLAATLMTSCTPREPYFQGVLYDSGGIGISADILNCGCATFRNLSPNVVRLQARLFDATLGSETLNPGQSIRFRFDWSGYDTDDRYVVEILERGSSDRWVQVSSGLEEMVAVEDLETQIPCEQFEGQVLAPQDPLSCEYRNLNMSMMDLPPAFRGLSRMRKDSEADQRLGYTVIAPPAVDASPAQSPSNRSPQ